MARPRSNNFYGDEQYGIATSGMEQEERLAQGYLNRADQMGTAAQQQLRQGLEQGQRNLSGAAAMGGANPFAQRSAVYAGGQMGVTGARQAQQLRAAELQSTQQGYMDTLGRGAGYLQNAQANVTAAEADEYRRAAEEERRRQSVKDAEAAAIWGAVGGGIGAVGSGLGAASDPNLKEPPNPRDEEDRQLGAFVRGMLMGGARA